MADPVATVEKIVKIGLKIKAAVDTVRHNQEECDEIRKRMLRFSAILSQLQQTGMMVASPALSGALEDLEESLQHALELVTACQETSTIRRLITAGDLSKQLRRVKEDILNKVMLASFAINTHTTIVLLTIHAGGHPHPPPRQTEDAAVGISHTSQSTNDARSELNEVESNLLAGNQGSIPVAIRKFRWSELKDATNGFSYGNLIGDGGTFTVYKGVLKDGSIVTIKRSNDDSTRPINYDELLTIVSKLEHKNIVKFMGYGDEVSTSVVQLIEHEKDQPKESGIIWVEEYVPNGSLQQIIHGRFKMKRSQEPQLDWSSIFRIIEGVAQGLQYLHKQRVLHKDVKPANILLDSNMNPIITDFNISKALDDDVDEMDDRVEGTFGFAAPEYLMTGVVSMKNDVFAFGTTLLLTVSSIRRCPDSLRCKTGWDFRRCLRWAWEAWEAGRIEEEFDPSLFDGSHQVTEMKRCVKVGLLCTQRKPEGRPTMANVVEMLHGNRVLPVPEKPAWFQEDGNTSHPVWLRLYMATKKIAAQVMCGR